MFSQYGQAAIDGTVPQWAVNEAVRVRGSKSAISEGDMKPTVVWVLQCMPVFELPEDADLVVRTAVLEELARRMLTLPDEKRPTPTATEPPEIHPEQTEPASEIERVKIRYLPEIIGLMARLSPPYDTLSRAERGSPRAGGRKERRPCRHSRDRFAARDPSRW